MFFSTAFATDDLPCPRYNYTILLADKDVPPANPTDRSARIALLAVPRQTVSECIGESSRGRPQEKKPAGKPQETPENLIFAILPLADKQHRSGIENASIFLIVTSFSSIAVWLSSPFTSRCTAFARRGCSPARTARLPFPCRPPAATLSKAPCRESIGKTLSDLLGSCPKPDGNQQESGGKPGGKPVGNSAGKPVGKPSGSPPGSPPEARPEAPPGSPPGSPPEASRHARPYGAAPGIENVRSLPLSTYLPLSTIAFAPLRRFTVPAICLCPRYIIRSCLPTKTFHRPVPTTAPTSNTRSAMPRQPPGMVFEPSGKSARKPCGQNRWENR